MYKLTKYTVIGTALSLILPVGMMAVGPGDSQALFSLCHRCRFTEVRPQDCSSHAPGPTVGAMEAAQTLAWPNPYVNMSTKPTAAKARPFPTAGALVVLLDVSWVLNLGSCQGKGNSMVHASVGRDFSPSSVVSQPLGLSCGFSPTSACVYAMESALEVARAHEPIRQEGAKAAIGANEPPRQEGAGVVIGMCELVWEQSGQVGHSGRVGGEWRR